MTNAFNSAPWSAEEQNIVRSYLASLGADEKVDRKALLERLHSRGFTHRTYRALASYVGRLRRKAQKTPAAARPAPGPGEQLPVAVDEKPRESVTVDSRGDSGVVETNSPDIRTLEDALAAADVDLETWEVDRYVVNWWDVTVSARKADGATPETYTNYQIKVWLKRKAPSLHQIIVEGLCDAMRGKAPKLPRHRPGGDHTAVVCLYDAHFGKLAWGPEVDSGSYDLAVARDTYLGAVADLLGRIRGMGIGNILLPIGQDLLSVDSAANTTEKGTPQDVDGRFPKIFQVACEAVARATTMCAELAPTEAVYVPGNHDWNTAWFLSEWMRAWFQGQGHAVTVDTSPAGRKFRRYGVNLIGMTHGDKERLQALPTIMADSVPQDWANSLYRHWLIGHHHRKRQFNFTAGDTFGTVEVRVVPSLCRTDRYHYTKGFVNNRRAAEAHIYHAEDGPVAYHVTNLGGAS